MIGLSVAMACVAAAAESEAAGLLTQAMDAMGGEARLKSLRWVTLDSIGHSWALEQSVRPEGPWLSTYQQVLETRDLELQRQWIEVRQRGWITPNWTAPPATIVSDGVAARTDGKRWAPGRPSDVLDMTETFALAPERLLFTARAAADLRTMPDEVQHSVSQRVLAFTWNGKRLRLFLNRWTHLPSMLEVVHDDASGVWGDVVEHRWYSFWSLEKGGLLYPRQITSEINGLPNADSTVETLTIDEPLDEAKFAIPTDTRTAYQAAPARAAGIANLRLDASKAVVVKDWIVQLPGSFNVMLVRQPDGVVVIEATTSGTYSQDVLQAAESRFPGVPVKAVVTTSDAWPHIGGIREYVARGIPVYALDLNVPILTRLTSAAHTLAPDTLQRQPKPPIVRPVSARTVIGSGENRVELAPVHGDNGERMMIAWLPGAHLLYTSDLVQHKRAGPGFFAPEMLVELEAAVSREHIEGIEQAIGMHLAPMPWGEIAKGIAQAKGSQ